MVIKGPCAAAYEEPPSNVFIIRPFQDAIRAGSGSIMCSYQRINNSYGCANSATLNGLLKTELGFQGYVVSDWGAQHAGVATALAGLDMTMPNSGFWGSRLLDAVRNGSVAESRITDMATRILTPWYQLNQDKEITQPGIGMPFSILEYHEIVDARNISALPTLFDGAVEGHVLVKNTNSALPLKKPRILSVYGYSARAPDLENPTTLESDDPWLVGATPLEVNDVMVRMGSSAQSYDPLVKFARNGTIISGGGSGATTAANFIAPLDAIRTRAYKDGTAVFWDLTSGKPGVVPVSDACLVFGNAWATEGVDRQSAYDAYTDNLIKHVASHCSNTIVVLHNAGIRLVDQFIDHPNVTAVIFAHLPGQETGPAIVSILYGESNPSGKLPYTVAKNESDYGDLYWPSHGTSYFQNFPQSNFTEGVFIDYRHFDAKNIVPRFEFGFGLSYTTFNYSSLQVTKTQGLNTSEYPVGNIVQGGHADLWDVLVRVSAVIGNKGTVDGAEVAQLYLGIPGGPLRQLRGFDKPFIKAGTAAMVTFALTRRDFSTWDTAAQKWKLQQGDYAIYVGSSSRKLPLQGTVTI
jgi:beta-glucosidase